MISFEKVTAIVYPESHAAAVTRTGIPPAWPVQGYNFRMSMIEQIQKDITAAMKAREEQRLST